MWREPTPRARARARPREPARRTSVVRRRRRPSVQEPAYLAPTRSQLAARRTDDGRRTTDGRRPARVAVPVGGWLAGSFVRSLARSAVVLFLFFLPATIAAAAAATHGAVESIPTKALFRANKRFSRCCVLPRKSRTLFRKISTTIKENKRERETNIIINQLITIYKIVYARQYNHPPAPTDYTIITEPDCPTAPDCPTQLTNRSIDSFITPLPTSLSIN